jgi:hypothetical protein
VAQPDEFNLNDLLGKEKDTEVTAEVKKAVADYNYVAAQAARQLCHEEIIDVLRGAYALLGDRLDRENPKDAPQVELYLGVGAGNNSDLEEYDP